MKNEKQMLTGYRKKLTIWSTYILDWEDMAMQEAVVTGHIVSPCDYHEKWQAIIHLPDKRKVYKERKILCS